MWSSNSIIPCPHPCIQAFSQMILHKDWTALLEGEKGQRLPLYPSRNAFQPLCKGHPGVIGGKGYCFVARQKNLKVKWHCSFVRSHVTMPQYPHTRQAWWHVCCDCSLGSEFLPQYQLAWQMLLMKSLSWFSCSSFCKSLY